MDEFWDEIEDDDQHQWHQRRICFMQDMVEHLDKQYFPNATIQQINDFAHSAVDFWKGKITSQEATEQLQSMRKVLQKDIMKLSDWEPKDFLLWMMMPEDDFDWMWDQWFECVGSTQGAIPYSYGWFPHVCPRTIRTCSHVYGSPLVSTLLLCFFDFCKTFFAYSNGFTIHK